MQRMPKKINPNWATSRHSKIKMQNISDKERILKAERGKKPVIQKGTPVKINKLIIQQKLWNQRKWHGVFKVLKGKITKTKSATKNTLYSQSITQDWCWSWSSNILAAWCEEMTHWKRLWFWERLGAGGEGGYRGLHGWMASSTYGQEIEETLGGG